MSDDYDKFEIGARRSSLTESISELATTADENANKALNQAVVAQQSADGKTTIYYLDSSDPWPTNPKENDAAFVKDGENSIMYRYMFNNDTGMFSWVKILDSMSADQIKQRVSDALESGKAYSDKLVVDNVAQVNRTLSDVQAKQADLTAQQAELDTKAQGYANKALADAKANTLATATQTAKDASDALAKAKTDLTTSLNKEVTDRANAVTALDTKAKGYADTAKADAISAGATADGVINKKIDDTASSITSTISQNKTDADGKITTAQSTATQALNGLATKVSQTVYDAKTGQLQTDLNTTTTTANQAKTDIVTIKSDNTKQDARMTTIESDANGTKTTVSNLQTDLGKANGSITTLQQRADGFDATVTKVNTQLNDLSQVNMVVNSEFSPDLAGWYIRGTQTLLSDGPNSSDVGFNKSGHVVLDTTNGTGTGNVNYTSMAYPVTPSSIISVSVELKASVSGTNPQIGFIYYDANMNAVAGQRGGVPVTTDYKLWKYTGTAIPATAKYVSFDILISSVYKAKYVMSQPMMVIGSTVGAYVQGQYNNNGATAKAQLTADQATTSLNTYKSDADGRISKAQADIIVNANAITQKVSQSDYNAKTGDLTTKVNTAQSTADSATSTIGAYKTSNDARVASAESKITQNTGAINLRVTKTDYDANNNAINGKFSAITVTTDKITSSVSDVKTQVDGLSVGGRNLIVTKKLVRGWMSAGDIGVSSVHGMVTDYISVSPNSNLVAQIWYDKGIDIANNYIRIAFFGSNKAYLSRMALAGLSDTYNKWDITTPTNTAFIRLSFDWLGDGYGHAKLEYGNMPTDWSPAPEDVDNKISTVSQTVDSISSIVSDPTTGLTKRVQTAEGTLSQVTGADIPNLQKATYWQPYGSLDLNTYKTQGSYYFNSTTAKPNGPTTSTDWMYMQVEVANSDKVTQIAWYDKTTSAKITYKRQYVAGTWSPWYANDNDSVTTIAQTNGAIQQEVKDRANGDTNTLTQAKDFTTSSITNYNTGMQSQFTQTSDAILAKIGSTGVRYVRINGQGNQDSTGTHFMRVSLFDSSGKDLLLGKTATVSGPNSPYFGGNNGGNGATDGNVNTYSAIYPEPNANNFMVYDLGAVTYTSQKFEVKMWTNYRTYKGVTIQVSPDNKSWRTILQEDVKSVSGDITKPDTTVNLGNTSSATQLALLKDNWSIGITGNTNKLASGIAANPSAMAIVSQKVIIDSPQTQITGTAWINSAMIGNGQIGNAQIGDAAITSAKIATLDVSKITGNVTNFIQSNWNGVYESTTITNNGMQIVTSDVTTTFGPYGIKLTQGGESVGGMGVSSYDGMPANFQGIAFHLDGTGDYMMWGARDSGLTTGDYTAKLTWFRSSYKPSGENEGFNFSSDSPVTFWGNIYGRENTEPLKIASFGMHGVSAGGIGHGNGSSAITFGGDGEIYIVSGGQYYKLAQFVKALQPLIGLGTWSAPKNINSSGAVTQWTNITT